jgi:hypothetical protein
VYIEGEARSEGDVETITPNILGGQIRVLIPSRTLRNTFNELSRG